MLVFGSVFSNPLTYAYASSNGDDGDNSESEEDESRRDNSVGGTDVEDVEQENSDDNEGESEDEGDALGQGDMGERLFSPFGNGEGIVGGETSFPQNGNEQPLDEEEQEFETVSGEICDDSVDNDGDSLIDIADDECAGAQTEGAATTALTPTPTPTPTPGDSSTSPSSINPYEIWRKVCIQSGGCPTDPPCYEPPSPGSGLLDDFNAHCPEAQQQQPPQQLGQSLPTGQTPPASDLSQSPQTLSSPPQTADNTNTGLFGAPLKILPPSTPDADQLSADNPIDRLSSQLPEDDAKPSPQQGEPMALFVPSSPSPGEQQGQPANGLSPTTQPQESVTATQSRPQADDKILGKMLSFGFGFAIGLIPFPGKKLPVPVEGKTNEYTPYALSGMNTAGRLLTAVNFLGFGDEGPPTGGDGTGTGGENPTTPTASTASTETPTPTESTSSVPTEPTASTASTETPTPTESTSSVPTEPTASTPGALPTTPAPTPKLQEDQDFDKYKQGLRQEMEKPVVKDPALAKIMDGQYRAASTIGSGSTAAAIRQEMSTGQPTIGSDGKEYWHIQKGKDTITALQNWLKQNEFNPDISSHDKAAAKNVIQDLREALSTKPVPWAPATGSYPER